MIMIAVFVGFAAGWLVSMQQAGFGLAVAVLLDATVVRSIPVPASMKLLGRRNWYLPRWLGWLPTFDLEGARGSQGGGRLVSDTPGDLAPSPNRSPLQTASRAAR